MENIPKPIKRSKELVPLSKDHHEGLLFGWKIKQGLKNGTPLKEMAAFIQWFWEAELEDHFRKEEQVLVPLMAKNDPLVQQMLEEHESLEALVHLCAMVQDEDIFLQLADGLHQHIRFEERVLFQAIEKNVAPQRLEAIYPLLLQKKPHRKWENAFWMKK